MVASGVRSNRTWHGLARKEWRLEFGLATDKPAMSNVSLYISSRSETVSTNRERRFETDRFHRATWKHIEDDGLPNARPIVWASPALSNDPIPPCARMS